MITSTGPSAIGSAAQATGSLGASAPQSATPASTAAADQKLQQMRDAVVKLKTVGDSAKAARSGAAMARLEALKQRLKMLMMMGGDPKMVARQAAQIAKEIGEAAKEYAAAGGGTPAPTAAPQASAPAAAAGAAAGDAPQTTEGANDAATATPGGAPGSAPSGTPLTGADSKTDPASAAKPSAKTAASTGPSAPDPVLAEAKTLAARAKALLKAAIERAKREHADPAEFKDDQDKVNAADKDIDDAARTLSAADTSASYSASGESVAAPATDAAPSVSVQA
jgi:hypothetical protein